MSNLDQNIERLRNRLRSSETAYTAGATPTKRDIKTERELRKAETEKSRKLGDRGKTSKKDEEESDPSVFSNLMRFLNAPVSLGAGAVETALGQGTETGLLENMRANLREGGTYGDVIRQSGASNWVAMPVGFALDVALDPINWATAGTTAIVPKIAKGISKKGVRGARVAAKAAASEKLDNMLALTSSTYRKNMWNDAPMRGRIGSVMERIATSAKESAKEYDELVEGGSTALDRLTKSQQTNVDKFISKIGDGLNKAKPGFTAWLKKHFWGDSKGWLDESKLAEDIRNAPDGPAVAKAAKQKEKREIVSQFEGDMAAKGEIPGRSASSADNQAKMASVMADDMEEAKMIEEKIEATIERYFKEGSKEAKRLRKMSPEKKEDYLATLTSLKADVQGYDKAFAKVLLNGTAQKFFKGHARLMGAFKAGVIGMSVPARVNQAIGNFTAFVPVAGINPFNTGFTKSLIRATKFSYTRDIRHIREMLSDDSVRELLRKYPDTFTKIMGIKAEVLSEGTEYLIRRTNELVRQGLDKEVAENMTAYIAKFSDDSLNAAEKQGMIKKSIGKVVKDTEGAARKEAFVPFNIKGTQFDTSLGNINITQEFMVGQVSKWNKELAKKAEKGDRAAKIIHWMMTKPLEDYGRGDQIFKFATMMHTTKNGISQAEMRTLQKWYKFKPGDVIQSKNGLRFKLTPEAAMDVANELFLNYSAMPSWSRIARALPMVGAPFASFAAGAQKNVLKGIGYNLSYFNKVRNLLHEISGEKGPMEREALESPYYDHITSNEAMVKLPFFKENPVYLNLGNALHIFDSNLLDAPRRDYESKYGKEFVSLIDKSPFIKDPTGQFMLNYLVLPYLLGEAIGPFNNELYSEEDTAAEKVGKAVTGAVEPFVPKTPGLGLAALPVPEEALPYVPSYGARRFKNATLGKGPTGRNSSESPESKTTRAAFAEVGLPVYRVQTNVAGKK